MPHFLHMAGVGEHGQHCLDQHPLVPDAAFADLEVLGVALLQGRLDVEAAVAKDQHLAVVLLDQWVECGIVDIGGIHRPVDHAPEMIQHETQLSPHDPAVIGFALLADLLIAAPFAPRMNEFNAEAVNHAQQRGRSQKVLCPILMGRQQAKEAGALGQAGEQRFQVRFGPAIEGPVADAFESKQ